MTWTNIHKINNCLPEFILEAFLKEIKGWPNNITEAVCMSFLASTSTDHTEVIVIDSSTCHNVYTSVHELLLCTPNLPCGVPLSECLSCGSKLHLKAIHDHILKVTVKCHHCSRGGQALYSNTDGDSLIFVGRGHPIIRHKTNPSKASCQIKQIWRLADGVFH